MELAGGERRQERFIKLRFTRVFVLRIWLGVRLLRFAIWVIGADAEVASE